MDVRLKPVDPLWGCAGHPRASVTVASPPSLIEVVEVQQGRGVAQTHAGRYPLGALTFVRASNGRGLISLKAGAGAFDLSGESADDLGAGRWRLHIDRTSILSASAARGACELVTRDPPPTYVSLSCRIRIGNDARPVTVEWRGDGSPAVRPRSASLGPAGLSTPDSGLRTSIAR